MMIGAIYKEVVKDRNVFVCFNGLVWLTASGLC